MILENKITIPQGWKLIQLGEVIELKYGKSLIKSKRDGGEYAVYGSSGIVGLHSKSLIDKSCLIVGRKGTIGEVTFSQSPCWAIDTTYYIDELHKQPIMFWFYRLKALSLDKLNRASAIPGLNREDTYKLVFPLPPLNEQKRIVTKIEALQTRSTAVKEELEAIKPLLNQFRQSVLASAFRGDLTKDWREQNPDVEPAEVLLERIRVERRCRWEEAELEKMEAKGKVPKDDKWKQKYKEPQPIDTEGLPGLPDDWCWSYLEILADVVDPNPSHRMLKYVDSGISFISTENFVEPENIDFSIGKKVSGVTLDKQKSSYKIKDGDFVLSRIGTIGKTRFLPTNKEYCLSHALVVIKPVSLSISPKYLKNLVSSNVVLQQAKMGVQSVGVPDLGMGKIRAFAIPFAPLEEQKEIVRRIESLFKLADSIKQQYQQAEVDLETLNQSILAKAFRGELVPQDPNDEPASVLLERIKEERDKAKTTAKKSKTKKKRSAKKKDKQLGIPGM